MDTDAPETGNHQSVIDQIHIEDEKPEAQKDEKPEQQLVEPVDHKHDNADNKSLSSRRSNSIGVEENTHETTAESDTDVKPSIQVDEEKSSSLSMKKDSTSIGKEEKLNDSRASSSSMTSSATSIEEYMDRFTDAWDASN
ncbi:uncharacterized protein LOC123474418 [Daphnia magna]|uniref:uncharacterized protein LOC123474418 n=1 Tax=Daphnia magna TaxID=35525 RepID=UPI001E1BD466|nr:uncharacterized protein LOC123474418 [Daphnia magna]